MDTETEIESDVGISVVIPVRNEVSSIRALLSQLEEQTLSPKEIVIVDGGSEDETAEVIRGVATKSSIPIVLFEAGEAFPGRGRIWRSRALQMSGSRQSTVGTCRINIG